MFLRDHCLSCGKFSLGEGWEEGKEKQGDQNFLVQEKRTVLAHVFPGGTTEAGCSVPVSYLGGEGR